MAAIHQFLAGFSRGDAISNEAIAMRRIFRSWGRESDIFSETKRILPELRRDSRDAAAAAPGPDDLAILHLSIGSPVNGLFASLRCRKAILYHNITPPAYFRALQPRIAADLSRGLAEARQLAGVAAINLADSAFNAEELTAMGYRDVRVLPLVLDWAALETDPARRVMRDMNDGKVNVLFVGRCAPNKKIEDVLTAFAFFQQSVEPNSRLIHAGSCAGTERYHALLQSLRADLRLRDVFWTGSIPQADLNAYYRRAHVFLCMSEHEGFCIPLVEAMLNGAPVVAYAAGAVPETLGGAGCLVHEKQYDLVAELMGRLTHDAALRAAVVRGQSERVARYRARDLGDELKGLLAPLL